MDNADVDMFRTFAAPPADEFVSAAVPETPLGLGRMDESERPPETPVSAEEFRTSTGRITDDWLLIEPEWGNILSGETALMVPAPVGELYGELEDDDGAESRRRYADELGLPLLMPGSPGTPLDKFPEQARHQYWLIDSNNDSAVHQISDIALVPIPETEYDYDELEADPERAADYAMKHARVPVAPFRMSGQWRLSNSPISRSVMDQVMAASSGRWAPPPVCVSCGVRNPTSLCTGSGNTGVAGEMFVYCHPCLAANWLTLGLSIPFEIFSRNPQSIFQAAYKLRSALTDPHVSAQSVGFSPVQRD